jgi:hypothetical protein
MAMGITQALKLQEGPIDALARLPQQQLIQMAQQGRIAADILPVILNEKAQMAEQAANMQAMQKPMPPSVTERNISINAQAEAPQMQPQPQMMAMAQPQMPPMDAGVASLPLPEDAYSMAGGGIVAFQEGGETEGLGDTFFGSEQMQYVYPDTRTRAEKERDYAYERYFKDQQKMRDVFSGKEILDRNLAEKRIGPEGARALQAQDRARPPLPAAAPAIRPSTPPAAAAPKSKAAAAPQEPELDYTGFRAKYGLDIEDPAMAEIRAKLATMGGESKLDRAHARDMALLQAGLGMMAGTSPYALANIGAGGMKGAEAYASSIKDIKAAEKDLFKMQTELAKADQARKDGNVKAFMDHQEKAKDYALKLRKANIDENVAQAQIGYYNRPGTYEEMGRAAEKYPWLKERFTAGTENLEMKVRRAAEDYVNSPMLLSQNPTLRDLMKKAKDGNVKATKELDAYKDQLREAYIRRNMPGGQGAAGAGAGGVKFLGYEGQ